MAVIKDLRPITPRTNGTRALTSIKNIARHHSGGETGNWASFWPYWNKTLGWGTGGYHEIILRDGTVELCYDPNEITNGVGGQNSYIYNICLVGNGSFTDAQENTWEERARYWMNRFGLPASAVKGHNEFPGQSTSCPGINMNTVRERLSGASIAPPTASYLQRGDTGDRVRAEQEKFKQIGYDIAIDGSFGPAMEKVVRQFQADNGLVVDGSHGPVSQAKLNELVNVKKETDEMAQKLPETQRNDMKGLLAKAYKDKTFNVDHTSKVDTMTRGEALDLVISYVARTK